MTPLCLSFAPHPSPLIAPVRPTSYPSVAFQPVFLSRLLNRRLCAGTGLVQRRQLVFSLGNDTSSPTIHFEEITEQDWSFLEPDSINEQEHAQRAAWAIAAAEVGENSRVLVSFGAEQFVDQLVNRGPSELLLVVHDSIFALAMIKEKHDRVRCWQGPIVDVPEKFSPFDVVFLCYLPAVGVPLNDLFKSLAERCSQGARVIINCHGRDVVEHVHRKQYPEIVTSDLPDKVTLENAASEHAFKLIQYLDDHTSYFAVLKFNGSD